MEQVIAHAADSTTSTCLYTHAYIECTFIVVQTFSYSYCRIWLHVCMILFHDTVLF